MVATVIPGSFSLGTLRFKMAVGQKINHNETKGLIHVSIYQSSHFGYIFLSHCQMGLSSGCFPAQVKNPHLDMEAHAASCCPLFPTGSMAPSGPKGTVMSLNPAKDGSQDRDRPILPAGA